MNRKIFVCFGSLLFLAAGLQAADFHVGIGAGGDFGVVFTSLDTNIPEPDKSQAEEALKNTEVNRLGFCFFVDLTYLELDLGGKYYNLKLKQNGYDLKETQSYFNIGFMGKYPFSLNDRFSLFPLAGFDFQFLTKVKDKQGGQSVTIDRSDLSDNNIDENYFDRIVFNFGIGMDITLVKGLFLRGMFIYGINFNTEQQKDAIDVIKDAGYDVSVLNHGPSLKLAIGYKF